MINPKDYDKLVHKVIRLESVVKVLLEADSTTEAIRELLFPFADNKGWVYGESNWEKSVEWEEKEIFNETRLYKALGKEDARSILGIWRRFHSVCDIIRKIPEGSKEVRK